VARAVHQLLLEFRRPVGIAMPEFRDPAAAPEESNWRSGDVWLSGFVRNRLQGMVPVTVKPPGNAEEEPVGHAVCVLGFIPVADEKAGFGWFVFRNSWGSDFAAAAPDTSPPPKPVRVPAPGYGVLSAALMEAACWEVFSPALAAAP
jgi:hypothetical protein